MINQRAKRNLAQAISLMRAACDDAERRARNDPTERSVQEVLHALTWGMANASSAIQSAMDAVIEQHEADIDAATETRKAG